MKRSFLVGSIFLLVLSGCQKATITPTPSPTTQATVSIPSPVAQVVKKYEITATANKQQAHSLLQTTAQVETKDYGSAGAFVTSINGLAGDAGHYWAFYVNGKYAQKGASQTLLNKGDKIQFIYEDTTPITK